MRRWFKRTWCELWHIVWTVGLHPDGQYYKRCSTCGRWLENIQGTHYVAPPRPAFDWLRDYGPLWEPGSTAFWLAPDTDAELTAWHNKYTRKSLSDLYEQSMYQNIAALRQMQTNPQLAQLLAQQSTYAQRGLAQGLSQQYTLFGGLFGRL